ncbi:MAG: hypothetical protein ACOC1K_00310 [Nanoarchaeota archaeon]
MIKNKKAQVWVETLIYTMIAFALIGAVLAFVNPKIQEMQDKSAIDNSLNILKEIDNTISEVVTSGQGNQRKLKIMIKKGEFIINSEQDSILFNLKSSVKYSEEGTEVEKDNIIIITNKTREEGINNIQLKINYSEEHNITFENKEILRTLNKDSSYYELFISNKKDKVNFALTK